jgi:hypothetical protein
MFVVCPKGEPTASILRKIFNLKVSIEEDTITIKHQVKPLEELYQQFDVSHIDFQRVDLIKE